MPKRPELTPEERMSNEDGLETVPAGERLQRVLAARGVASRRASEEMITAGRVIVNGKVVNTLGSRVDPVNDEIRLDGKVLRRQRPRYLMLNKPTGFITTLNDERQRWTVMDLIKVQERVYPVGRLDRDTQGLLLLTNDGLLANRVMHPRYGLTKEYHVITNNRPSDPQLQDIRDGLLINDRLVVPDECRLLRETSEGIVIRVVLHEGLYHVVRRMMEIVNINVVKLRRVRLGPLTMMGIPPGGWRDLTTGELTQIFEAVGLPLEDAARANQIRTIQSTPTAGFKHGARVAGGPVAAAPVVQGPAAGETERRTSRPVAQPEQDGKEAWKRAGQGERTRRPIRRDRADGDSPTRTRRTNDGSRPSVGRRDRRSGGRG